PGVIEGAHEGVREAFRLLRHVERPRIIVHMIELASLEDRDPFDDYQRINKERESYGSNLIEKPQVIVANKIDMPGSEEKLEKLKEQLTANTEVVEISPYTQTNVDKLLYKIADKLENLPHEPHEEEEITIRYEEKEAPFKITRSDDGAYVLSGPKIE